MNFKYKIIRNIFSEKYCNILIKKTEASLKKQKIKLDKYKRSNKFYGELMNPFVYDSEFYHLLLNKTIHKELSKILGNNYQLNMFTILKKNPGEILRNDKMHIDGKHELKSLKKTLQLNLIISLTNSNKFIGTTLLNLKNKKLLVNLNPGDCLIYNSFLQHRGTKNYTNVPRYMAGINIIPHFIKSRFDYYELTNRSIKNDNLKKILGYNFRPPKSLNEFFKKKSYIVT